MDRWIDSTGVWWLGPSDEVSVNSRSIVVCPWGSLSPLWCGAFRQGWRHHLARNPRHHWYVKWDQGKVRILLGKTCPFKPKAPKSIICCMWYHLLFFEKNIIWFDDLDFPSNFLVKQNFTSLHALSLKPAEVWAPSADASNFGCKSQVATLQDARCRGFPVWRLRDLWCLIVHGDWSLGWGSYSGGIGLMRLIMVPPRFSQC